MQFIIQKKDGQTLSKKLVEYLYNLKGGKYTIEIKKSQDKRTIRQNSALHLYFTLLAEALNESGHDMKKTIREDVDTPWSAMTVKEHLWRPIQIAQLRKGSTTKLTTSEIDKVYDVLNKVIAERTGVMVEFPSIENLMNDYGTN